MFLEELVNKQLTYLVCPLFFCVSFKQRDLGTSSSSLFLSSSLPLFLFNEMWSPRSFNSWFTPGKHYISGHLNYSFGVFIQRVLCG